MNRRVSAGVLSLVVAAGMTGCGQASSQTGPPPQPDPLVVFDQPVTRTVTDFEEFPGRTEAIYTVEVRARVSGYLKRVYFQDGQEVHNGDVLFMIDPRPFQAALDRAKAAVGQAEARSQRTANEYRRAKVLFDQGKSISREEFDRYAFDHTEAEAAVTTAKANADLSTLDVDWTKVTADLPEGMVGRLSRRMVDPGNLIKADETLMTTVVTEDPLHVYFDVHEQAMLKLGHLVQQGKVDPSHIPVNIALSDEENYPHEGTINFTDNRVDPSTGTLRFRALVKNPGKLIKPGLFVRVRVTIGEPHSTLMVREKAIQTDQSQKKVFVLKPLLDDQGKPKLDQSKGKDGETVSQPLYVAAAVDVGVPGVLQGDYREISAGLGPEDMVVVSGMQKIRMGVRPGTKTEKNPQGVPFTVHARKYDPEKDAVAAPSRAGAARPATPSPAAAVETSQSGGNSQAKTAK